MSGAIDLAVCIPTFNRADILRATLDHLLDGPVQFKSIIISDNASTDHTPEVCREYQARHPGLKYYRQPVNLGPMRNIHAALTYADQEFCYLLSDDDRLYHENIAKAFETIRQHPDWCAIYGKYDFVTSGRVLPSTGGAYGGGLTIIDLGNITDHITSSSPHHPIYRTDTYRRNCYFDDATFGFWRTFRALLNRGQMAVVDYPFYLHLQTEGQIESKILEPWYGDFYRSDLEYLIASLNPTGADQQAQIATLVARQEIYFQGVAYYHAMQVNDAMAARHCLIRMKAYVGCEPALLARWDSDMLIAACLTRLSEQVALSHCRTLYVQDGAMRLGDLLPDLKEKTGIDRVIPFAAPAEITDRTGSFVLFEYWQDAAANGDIPPQNRAAFADLVAMLQLTPAGLGKMCFGPGKSAHFLNI